MTCELDVVANHLIGDLSTNLYCQIKSQARLKVIWQLHKQLRDPLREQVYLNLEDQLRINLDKILLLL